MRPLYKERMESVTTTPMSEIKTPKRCVIEFQGFRNSNGRFIIKELVIYDMTTHVLNYFVFKPPFNFRQLSRKANRTNNWLTSNFHHITWDEGFTEYKELNHILQHYCNQYDKIYTSGEEKSKFIERRTANKVVNIELNRGVFPDCFQGLCIGIQSPAHKFTNCAMSRAFRVGTFIDCGGEEAYKSELQPLKQHLSTQSTRGNIDSQATISNGFEGTDA